MRARLLILMAVCCLPVLPGTANATRAAGRWAEHTAARALHHHGRVGVVKASSVRRSPWKKGPHPRVTAVTPKKAQSPAPRVRPKHGHGAAPTLAGQQARRRAQVRAAVRLRLGRHVVRSRSVHRLNEVDLK